VEPSLSEAGAPARGTTSALPLKPSKSESARVKVASLAKSQDNAQQRLIPEPPPAKKSRESSAPSKPVRAPEPSKPPKTKLRMKLVKGKWIRVDEGQSLF
jgi:hypothetical protein